MNHNINKKKVAVILGFYNGNKYINQQIASIINQTHSNLKLFIFDDNSPKKLDISNCKFNSKIREKIIVIERVTNLGFAKNFLYGLKDVGDEYDYYAFSDQDDIWETDKIEKSIKSTKAFSKDQPILYSSRTAYYDSGCLREIGSSKKFKKKPSFTNALIQNICGGNTILMNKKAREIVINSLGTNQFIAHDWWCYQIISAAGGSIILSQDKTVKYRQHGKNIIGGNKNIIEKLKRFNKFFSGRFREWNDKNIENLKNNQKFIKKENIKILNTFIKIRESKNILERIILFYKIGIFRQSHYENLIFFIGILLNKI